MSDIDNDIDALMKVLDPNSGKRPTWDNWEVVIFAADAIRHHAALRALVAERDALRALVALEAPIRNPLSSALQLEEALWHEKKEGGGA